MPKLASKIFASLSPKPARPSEEWGLRLGGAGVSGGGGANDLFANWAIAFSKRADKETVDRVDGQTARADANDAAGSLQTHTLGA